MGNLESSSAQSGQIAHETAPAVVHSTVAAKSSAEMGPPAGILKKSLTFDERGMDASRQRQDRLMGGFLPLKKAMTFVDKHHAVQTDAFGYQDILYRTYYHGPPAVVSEHQLLYKRPSMQFAPADTGHGASTVEAPTLRDEIVVVVDPFSTGATLVHLLNNQGFQVVCVLSRNLGKLLSMVADGLNCTYVAKLEIDEHAPWEQEVNRVITELQKLPGAVIGVLAGAETGVELCDTISERLGNVPTNGTSLSRARRNKYIMGETVRKSGTRAVKQLLANTWTEIEQFISEWQPDPFKIVIKPMESAGSDDVTLCSSLEELQEAFGNIMGKVNGIGQVNDGVLVQEFLDGIEYIVDCVSHNGEHKLVGLWEYDRRPTNGAGFVCHGQKLMSSGEPWAQGIFNYQKNVLDALGIKHGPTHGEVKICKDEPVLVEVGARCQGADGFWLDVQNECLGYDQASVTVAAATDADAFAAVPTQPATLQKHGRLKFIVSYVQGKLVRWNEAHLAEIRNLPSFRGMQLFLKPGDRVHLTQNCFTWIGCVKLVHEDENALLMDYHRIEEMQHAGIVETEPIDDERRCVVVIDPFSTGAVIAANAAKLGYKCICVYSRNLELLDNHTSFVPGGLELSFDAVIKNPDPENVQELVDKLQQLDWDIVAVMAGAETGAELADELSAALGLRSNGGAARAKALRSKYVMGETIQRAGLRAVQQALVMSVEEAMSFVERFDMESSQLLVKPLEGAATDDALLCSSPDEVYDAVTRAVSDGNCPDRQNKAVLLQEYLDGTAYAVDAVSLNGEHKILAVWRYDRQPMNGRNFVCHSQWLLTSADPVVQQLVEFQRKVLDVLGIRNGPSHAEVKMCRGEPALLEVGAHCHGADGAWCEIADGVMGYNQAQVALDAYLRPEEYASIPGEPTTRMKYGQLLFVYAHYEGDLADIDAGVVREIEQMPSFVDMELFPKVRGKSSKTVDCFLFGGIVKLLHENLDTVSADYNRIRNMATQGLFLCTLRQEKK